jgi:hypothetical protein
MTIVWVVASLMEVANRPASPPTAIQKQLAG